MKERAFRLFRQLFMTLILGLAYAGLCSVIGYGIPCPLNYLTGLYCPACGLSRMCIHLLKLDFPGAFQYNPCIFCLLPVLAIFFCSVIYRYIRTGDVSSNRFQKVLSSILIVILCIFGILRNLPQFNLLRPPAGPSLHCNFTMNILRLLIG